MLTQWMNILKESSLPKIQPSWKISNLFSLMYVKLLCMEVVAYLITKCRVEFKDHGI